MAEKGVRVKNKQIAPVQITAEQLLREATVREDTQFKPPKQRIVDGAELNELRYIKRKTFEDMLRRHRQNMGIWLRYGKWEEEQRELPHARSVYERAIDVDHRSVPLWLRYVEMEMRFKNINHARNIFDRAVSLLPRVDTFWYKYAYMEEMLGNVQAARQVFERWLDWEPEETAWASFVKFESRYGEWDRVRSIYERWIIIHPSVKIWLRYAKFEEDEQKKPLLARAIYERAVEFFGGNLEDSGCTVEQIAKLLTSFAKFETQLKEYERARVIYQFALSHLPKLSGSKAVVDQVYKTYTQFEKQFGESGQGIEQVIIEKRRNHYEKELEENEKNYDVWFDYIQLEKDYGTVDKVREVFERAIAQVPPDSEKRFWRRYIYLWINYAFYEELEANDLDRAEQVYRALISLIPHKKFTFAKVWILLAKFLIRKMDLTGARKVLGQSIGMCPKAKLFKAYIEIEVELREFDRCRKLYEKFLEFNPASSYAWIKYTELESMLGEMERARALFELSVSQPIMDMPELIWKAYIDFELQEEGSGEGSNYERTRKLYERLVKLSEHVKVWISFANFESSIPESVQPAFVTLDRTRAIYERANASLKLQASNVQNPESIHEQRLLLLEAWKEFESSPEVLNGTEAPDSEALSNVQKKFPKRVKKRRPVINPITGEANPDEYEEYYQYVFPDDQEEAPHLKLLAMAQQWKQKKGN